jgi:hypothetical protein
MPDISLSPSGGRHIRSAWILAFAIIIIVALATLSGLAAQLANQGAWDADSGASEQAPAN